MQFENCPSSFPVVFIAILVIASIFHLLDMANFDVNKHA